MARTLQFGLMMTAAVSAVTAGEPSKDRLTPKSIEVTFTKTVEINYLLYLPDGYEDDGEKRWPLVVFLHGAGERGDDLAKVKVHGPPRYVNEGKSYPFVLVAPQCPDRRWWDSEAIVELIDKISGSLRVDPDRVYLTGLSMGGFGTWNTAALAPDRFAAIAPVCGGGDLKKAPRLKNVPVWAFHGVKDPVVPIGFSRDMVEAVNRAGGSAKLTEYPEAGHDSWTDTYENPKLYEWLLSHRRTNSNGPRESEPRSEVRGGIRPDQD